MKNFHRRSMLSTALSITALLSSLLVTVSTAGLAAETVPDATDVRGGAARTAAAIAMLEAIPDYVPEYTENDPRLAPYRHRELNALEFGAKADGKSHPLRQTFGSQAAIDDKYGKGRYTLDDEADFVAIMEMIRISKGCGHYIASERDVVYASTIYLPVGIYMINRTIPITDTYGATIRGDGRGQTALRFNEPMPLFAISRSGFLSFDGFIIESNIASRSTGFFVSNPDNQAFGKPTFNMTFDTLMFQRLYKAIQITGHVMTDSMIFTRIRFLQCMTSFQLQNPQGLNYQFIGCNFEVHGDNSIFAPFKPEDVVIFHIQAGGNITVIGGSIIHSGITLLLQPDDAYSPNYGPSPSINWGSGIYSFYGTRWEQSGGNRPVLFDVRDDKRFSARINYDNCMIYQMVAALKKPVAMLHPGLNVTFRNSVFNDGVIQGILAPGQNARKSTLILDNTSGLRYEEAKLPDGETAAYHHLVQDRTVTGP